MTETTEKKDWLSLSKDEISTIQVEKEKEYRTALGLLNVVENEAIRLEKEMVDLRDKMSALRHKILDNERTVKKATYNIKSIKSEQKELEKLYWKK